jgi:hypothetical protein
MPSGSGDLGSIVLQGSRATKGDLGAACAAATGGPEIALVLTY